MSPAHREGVTSDTRTHEGLSLLSPQAGGSVWLAGMAMRNPTESERGNEFQASGLGRGREGWNERLSFQGSWAYFNGQGQQRNDQEEKSLPLQISRDLVSIIPGAVPCLGLRQTRPNQFYIYV